MQPPGAWHTVYTPTKGMTSGMHFLMYDALHLTERSRAFDKSKDANGDMQGKWATNDSHLIERQLLCMMLAMPHLVESRGIDKLYLLCSLLY